MFPPAYPKILIPNYLTKLRDDIKIIGISSFLKDWHNNKFPSYMEAAKKFEISESFYRSFITGRVPIPIWALKLLFIYDKTIPDKICKKEIYFTARNTKDKLPTHMDPRLSYYIGFLHGDGHIDSNERRVSFSEKCKEQLNLMNELTHNLFNVEGSIYLKRGRYGGKGFVLDVRRVTVNSFLWNVIGIEKGKRKNNKIPEIIKENKELLRWYLCGLFDAEGAMPLNPVARKNLYVDLAMTDLNLVSGVKQLLENTFGIVSYGPYKRTTNHISSYVTMASEIRIRKHSEIVRFLNTIGTLHPDKVRRKELILKLLHP